MDEEKTHPGDAAPHAGVVLIVEDDDEQSELLRAVVEEAGFVARIAKNGREGLDLLISLRPEPLVVVLDLQMPVVDGWQLLAIMRSYRRLSVIPVIAVSATGVLPEARAVFEVFLAKPIDAAALTSAIARLVERRA